MLRSGIPSTVHGIARIVGCVLVGVEAFVALALGRAHPNDLFGAVVLGWTVAAAVHLCFGSPGGRPTLLETRTALVQLGLPVSDVRIAERQPVGSTLMYADVDGRPGTGDRGVPAAGGDQHPSSRTWNASASRGGKPTATGHSTTWADAK